MKRKSKLFLNIATIALCLCAIAVGVYSAKTASLNVGGTVGFIAHNCEIHINGKITGTTDDTASALTYDQDLTSGTTANTWNFGSISFVDNHSDTPAPIVFTITFTNNSAFKVQSVLTLPSVISKTSGSTTLNSITAKIYNNSDVEQTTTESKYTFVLGEKNSPTASVTLKVKLMLNNNDESIDTSTLSNFGVTFNKAIPDFTSLGYTGYYDETKDGIVLTGVPEGSGTLIIPKQLGIDGEYKNVIEIDSTYSRNNTSPNQLLRFSNSLLSSATAFLPHVTPTVPGSMGYTPCVNIRSYTKIIIPNTISAFGVSAFTSEYDDIERGNITSIVFEETATWGAYNISLGTSENVIFTAGENCLESIDPSCSYEKAQ